MGFISISQKPGIILTQGLSVTKSVIEKCIFYYYLRIQ
jgi:hypothetical protein